MPQDAPDTLPGNFFKTNAPDTLPGDFFKQRESSTSRKRHTLTGKGSGESTPPKPASEEFADLGEGTAKVASYGALPVSLALAPIPTAAGLAGGYVAGKVGQKAAEEAGASPGVSRLVGQAAGAAGGGAAAKYAPPLVAEYGPKALRAGGAAVKAFTPKWMQNLHGKLISGLTDIADAWNGKVPEPPPVKANIPDPMRPSSAVARTMKYSGSTDPGYGTPGRSVGMSGSADRFKTPQELAAKQAEVKPHEPFRTNPATARRMEFGGSSVPESSSARGSVGMGGKASRFRTPEEIARAKADAKAASKETGTQPKAKEAPKPSPKSALPSPKPATPSNVTRAAQLADVLRQSGATPELVRMVTPEQWKTIAQSAGLKEPPNEATIKAAIDLLGKPKQIRVTRR